MKISRSRDTHAARNRPRSKKLRKTAILGGVVNHSVQCSGRLPGHHAVEASLQELIRVSVVNGRKQKHFVHDSAGNANITLNLPTESSRGRRIVLAQLPGEVWVFIQKGAPMTKNGRTSYNWPHIHDNVEPKKRWIMLVINDAGFGTLAQDSLNGAEYFECPADRMLSRYRDSFIEAVNNMEALQEIGRTNLADAEIRAVVQRLGVHWSVSDSNVWNSQHFCLHLAASILTDSSFQAAKSLFISLSQRLWAAANATEVNFMVAKHLGCMAGMVISGILTRGIGAVGFWAGAGASMGRSAYVNQSLSSQAFRLRLLSERFRGWTWIGG